MPSNLSAAFYYTASGRFHRPLLGAGYLHGHEEFRVYRNIAQVNR